MCVKMRAWCISLLVTFWFCWSPASSATCGGTFKKASGNFSSPNYPEVYPSGSDCHYIVLAAPNARTELTCKSEIERSKGCVKDYLRLNKTRYCGLKSPKGLIIAGSFALKFHSDAKENKQGFQCNFQRLFSDDFTETTIQASATSNNLTMRERSETSCQLVLEFLNSWNGGWNGRFKIPIKNDVNGWTLEVNFDKKINIFEVWSANLAYFSNYYVKMTPKSYNTKLNAGSQLTLDFLYRFQRESALPIITSVKFNGEDRCRNTETTTQASSTSTLEPSETSCQLVLEFFDSWDGGKNGKFKIPITNDVSGWTLEVDFDKKINEFEVWSAILAYSDDYYVKMTPKSYNTNLNAGSQLTLDFLYRFQRDSAIPAITSVKFNGKELCRNTANCVASSSCNNVPYNYDEVLRKSLLFYEAQRSGDLPESQRVKWRKDSALDDAKDWETKAQIDLEGGYYDAGDYIKFGFPLACTATVLAWGAIENRKAYEAAGQWNHMKEAVKWATDYFIKAHVSPFVFYGQVGLRVLDHNKWGRPEDMQMDRPAFKITKQRPGSDLAGETAAALAAASILFRDSDANYANLCLSHAKNLYNFANSYRGKYSDSISDAKKPYGSWSYGDELAWAAAWLHRATKDASYLNKAVDHYSEFGLNYNANEFSWNEKTPGVQVLLAQLTKDQSYITAITTFCDYIVKKKPRTPKGLVHISNWGSLRHASNVAFICLRAAAQGINSETYIDFAKEQIHYILGDAGRSFVVGFGNNPPQRPHHRSSSCPSAPAPCDKEPYEHSPEPNPQVLEGALVGGPDINDFYKDNRSDWVMNEVACDYNAGFQSAVAELLRISCCA